MNQQRAHEDQHFAHDDAEAGHARLSVGDQPSIRPAEVVFALDRHHGAKIERLADTRIPLFTHPRPFMHAGARDPLAGVKTGVGAELAGSVKTPQVAQFGADYHGAFEGDAVDGVEQLDIAFKLGRRTGRPEVVFALDRHHGAKIERLADTRIPLFTHPRPFMHAGARDPLAGVKTGVGAELAGSVKNDFSLRYVRLKSFSPWTATMAQR